MTPRTAAVVAVVGLAGCMTYSGGARAIDPARLSTEPGWVVAASTPELRQEGSLDCGAASLAMIAGRWDVALSVDDAAASLPAPTEQGIRLGDLRDAARAEGLDAYAIAGDRETLIHEVRTGRPVIVGLVMPYGRGRSLHHFEVIVAVHPADDAFVTIDPARGWRSRSWAELDAEWAPGGRPTLVVLGPVEASPDASSPTAPGAAPAAR